MADCCRKIVIVETSGDDKSAKTYMKGKLLRRLLRSKRKESIMEKNTKTTKTLNVTICCEAWYTSSIEVPADMSIEEALKYAKEHIDEIPISSGLEYCEGSDRLDEANCGFDD